MTRRQWITAGAAAVAFALTLASGCEGDLPLDDTGDATPRANIHQQRMDDWIAEFTGYYEMTGQLYIPWFGDPTGWADIDAQTWHPNQETLTVIAWIGMRIAPDKEDGYYTITIGDPSPYVDPIFSIDNLIRYRLLAVDSTNSRLFLWAGDFPANHVFVSSGHGQSPMLQLLTAGYTWNEETQTLTLTTQTAWGESLVTRWEKRPPTEGWPIND